VSGTSLVRALGRLVPRAVRNWLRSPRASLRWLADEVRFRAAASIVEIRPGWRLQCHPAAYRTAYQAHVTDPEQRRELDAFIDACRPGMVLYDVGAHFGLFSLAAVHYGGSAARAVAVEPSAFACRMLRLEAGANRVTDRVTVVRAAAGDRPGTMEMIPVGVIAAGYYSAATDDYGRRERETVRVVTVDELAQELGLWPTHIKVDVEGAEASVLAGARAALARRPAPWLGIELHNAMIRARGQDPGATLELLGAMNLEIHDLDGRRIDPARALAADLIRVTAHPVGV